MVFGDNCVLAELRAHYPEHRHNRRQRQDKTRQDKTTRPHATRRRHSTITQHYHKDTTLNQQRRDSKHTERQSDAKGAAQHKVPDPPKHGASQHAPPAIQHSHQANNKGRRQHVDGDTNGRQEGRHHTAALPSHSRPTPQRHPTIHNAPTHHHDEGGAHRGYPTTQRPQTDTHHHTPHTRRRTVHDTTAALTNTAAG